MQFTIFPTSLNRPVNFLKIFDIVPSKIELCITMLLLLLCTNFIFCLNKLGGKQVYAIGSHQRWSKSAITLSDPILFQKNDIRMRLKSSIASNHTIRIQHYLKSFFLIHNTIFTSNQLAYNSWGAAILS